MEVKDLEDERIEVDDIGTDCGHASADPETYKVASSLQPRSEANELQAGSSGTEGVGTWNSVFILDLFVMETFFF